MGITMKKMILSAVLAATMILLITACGGSHSSANDEAISTIYAISCNEIQEMLDAVHAADLDEITRDVYSHSVINKTMSSIKSSDVTIYVIDDELDSQMFLEMQHAVTNALSPFGSTTVENAIKIAALNYSHSYNNDSSVEAGKAYVVSRTINNETCAVTICYANDMQAIETYTLPILGDATQDFKAAKVLKPYRLTKLATPKLSQSAIDKIIGKLSRANSSVTMKPIAAFLEQIAKMVAAKATDSYLSNADVPASVLPLCQKCGYLAESPDYIISWDIDALLSEYVYGDYPDNFATRYRLASEITSGVQAEYGNNTGMVAQSIMRVCTATPILDAGNSVFWLYYYDCVCGISILKNDHNCYDVVAMPIYTGEIAKLALDVVSGDTSGLEARPDSLDFDWLYAGRFMNE